MQYIYMYVIVLNENAIFLTTFPTLYIIIFVLGLPVSYIIIFIFIPLIKGHF